MDTVPTKDMAKQLPICQKCKHETIHRIVAGQMECTNCGKHTNLKFGGSKQTKWRSKSVVHDGHWYQSGLEGKVGEMLGLALRGGLIKKCEWQEVITIEIDGIWIANYKCDFKITHLDDTVEWVEAKGAETERYRIIKRLMLIYLKAHPTELYTVFKDDTVKEFYQNGHKVEAGKFWKR